MAPFSRAARALAVALLGGAFAAPLTALTYQLSASIAGDSVPVAVELTDVAGGTRLRVAIPAGSGDLLGVFGNVQPEGLADSMGIADSSGVVTQSQLAANQVTKVGAGNTLLPVERWDWGVKLGATGSGGGAVESATFVLTGVSVAQLTAAANQGWRLGVRIQGTQPSGSAKVGLPEATPPLVSPPTIAIASPANGDVLSAAFTVRGSVDGGGGATAVVVNGAPAGVSGGSWSVALTLPDGAHSLTATATNSAGSASDAIEVRVDATGPVLTVTSPADGSLTSQTPAVVSGKVQDASEVSAVAINGVAYPVRDGVFSGSAALAEGANTLSVSAVDAQGNPGAARVAVTLDSTAPVVTLDAPPDGALTALSILATSGEVADASPIAAFSVNGAALALSDGRFETTLALPLGASEITASATDAAGNTGSAGVTVTRGELPEIAIRSPAPGLLTSAGSVEVSGTSTGATSVRVNGVQAALSGGIWSASVALVEGSNSLSAVATNAFGSAEAQTGVTRDSVPPVVRITSPAAGAEFSAPEIRVAGLVEDASPVLALSLNGTELLAANGFDAPFRLADGSNTLVVSATDLAGNVGSASVHVALRSGPLSVEIAAPAEGAFVAQDRIAVGGIVSDPHALVRVNGVSAIVTGASWIAASVPLGPGGNTLTATATSGAQSATDAASVVFRRAPEIAITSPLDGSVVRGAQLRVEGLVSTPAAFVDVNGIAASVDSSGRFVASAVPVEAGEGTLVARAVDLEGAVASDQAIVTRDDAAAPTMRIVLAYPVVFSPWGINPAWFAPRPDRQHYVAWSRDEEYLAGLRKLGRSPEAFEPPLRRGVIGWYETTELYVLSDSAEVPTISIRDGNGAVAGGSGHIASASVTELAAEVAALDYPVANPEVFAPADFDARYFHHFWIYTSGAAEVTVRASDSVSQASLSALADNDTPVGEVTAPTWDTVVPTPSVVVSGPVSDDVSIANVFWDVYNFTSGLGEIEIAGAEGEAFAANGRFVIPDTVIGATGTNLVYVYAYDPSGELELDPVRVRVDPTVPAVRLASPLDGQAVVDASTPLSFHFSVPLTVVSINGAPIGQAFLAGLHEDLAVMPLELGPNAVEIVVDSGGGQKLLTFAIYRVAQLEGIEITSPGDAVWVNQSTLDVEGSVPLGTPYVEVNGVPALIEPNGVRWSAQIPVPQTGTILGEDEPRPYRITAIAYPQGDAASVEVKPDLLPPSFGSVIPQSGVATVSGSATYGGWVSEVGTITLAGLAFGGSVHTTPSTLARDLGAGFLWPVRIHRFDFAALPLAEGPNAVTLTARDRAGNETTAPVAIERVAPALALVSPAPGASVPGLAADLVVSVSGDLVIDALMSNRLYVPSASGAALSSGTQTVVGVPLEPGDNELRVVYHRAGALAQQSLSFVLTSTATNAAVVTGIVTDSRTGQPVAGALVSLTVDGRTLVVVTDALGRYRAFVAPGAVTGTVYASLYGASAFQVTASSGQTASADTALDYTGVASLGNEVRILVPPAGAVTDWERITVVGTVLRPDSAVTVNGVTADVVGNRFTARGIDLAMGANTIRVVADALGAPSITAERALERSDTPVLDVEIYAPPDGAVIPGNGFVVRGWVSAKDAIARVESALVVPEEGVFTAYDILVPEPVTVAAAHVVRPAGQRDDDTAAVSFASRELALGLTASPPAGIVPLETQIEVGTKVSLDLGRIDFDFDSDGTVEARNVPATTVVHTYSQPAAPEARVLLTTPHGVELTASASVSTYLPHALGSSFAGGNPVDLADGPGGDFFVLDRAAGILRRFHSDTTPAGEIGAGAGLLLPEAIDSDGDGTRLVVADTGNSRVVVLDALGGVLAAFGTHGAGDGQLAQARGIGLSDGFIAVADSGNDRVAVFKTDGAWIGAVPLADPRAVKGLASSTFLVASPSAGLRVLEATEARLRIESADSFGQHGSGNLPAAPFEVAAGGRGPMVADHPGPRVLLYGKHDRLLRTIDTGLPSAPLAVLGSARREVPAFFLADGERVHEVALPVPSPLPVATALRDRLRAGDRAGALSLIHPAMRPQYERTYQRIGANLSAYGRAIGALRVDLLREDDAIVRAALTDANGVTLQMPIRMQRRSDGQWWVVDY